ncbi:MAG TPA: CocE/NonD family hydrolase [Gemmatimonadales bacterium]|nr:CocE/NonD family hydrolase [Gemmatimonadales bacterium]
MSRCAGLLLTVLITALLPLPAGAQQPLSYARRELAIPMRDGVHLFAVALLPKAAAGPLPILLVRTPYGAAGAFRTSELPGEYRELAQDGYIFVAEDIRGRFGSEGEFVMTRAQQDPRSPPGINESTDAYDTIDWLVGHLPGNSGKVGVLGTSYPGWLAALAGVGAHPALKAISPQAPMTDTWLGDDFFHQGAFRQTQGVEFAAIMETDPRGFHFPTIPDYDHYEFYRRFPTLDSLARAMRVTGLPSWKDYVAHPAWDGYWQAKALQRTMVRPEVPTLTVGGWWDQEDILGPQLAYHTLERADTGRWNHIVLGPWFHGGWNRPGGDSLGPIQLGSATADSFRATILRPWFAWYLHGRGDGRFPEARMFETGENAWHSFDAWPPRQATPRKLYLREHGGLAFDPAPGSIGAADGFDAYRSDPAHPIPYRPRPDDGSGWQTWLQQDQRFVDGRPDVLTYESAPLEQDLTIAGDVVAHLYASTTGTDADWVVKLIDVYPDSVPDRPAMGGYQLMVNADVMRGRYWRSFSRPTPIPAGVVTPFTVDLHEQLYRFKRGHRLMVQVQSSWFPLYDRNPQTFVPNIFRARSADFRAREHRVWHTPRYPSHIVLRALP